MADYTITDIVDEGALKQLDELADKFITVKTSYVDLASELGKKVSLPVNNFEDLANKMNEFVEAQKSLAASQSEMVATLKQLQGAIAAANQQTQQRTRVVNEGQQATQRATETDKQAALEKAKAAQAAREEKRELNLAAKEAAAYERATRSMTDAEKANVKTLEMMSVQYAKLKRQLRDMDVNSAEFKKVSAEAKKLHDEMNRLQMATGNTSLNVGNYTESIQKAILGNSTFGQSVTRLTIIMQNGGLKAALSEASVAIGAFGKALWALATNPYFIAITAALVAIKGLYEGVQFWVEYNEETAKAKRLTGEFLDETGKGLQEIFADIKAISEVYGKDYMDVLQSVDTLTKQFGLSSKDALDIIKDGFVAGADDGGEFLSMLKQYAPAFRDAGIEAKELVAIIAQTRSGIFNEQGLALMSMAFRRIREMSNNTREALQAIGIDVNKMQADLTSGSLKMVDAVKMVSDKLKELPDNSKQVGEVMKDVFGRNGAQGGLLLIETLADLDTALDSVKEKTGEVGQSQERLVEATKEYDLALDRLFGVSEGGWERMKNDMKTAWTIFKTKVIVVLAQTYNKFVDLWNGAKIFRQGLLAVAVVCVSLQRYVWNAFAPLMTFIKGVLQAIEKAFNAIKFFGMSIKAVFEFDFDAFQNAAGGFASSIGDAFKSVTSSGLDAVKEWGDGVRDIINDSKKGFNEVANLANDSYNLKKVDLGSDSGGAGFVSQGVAKLFGGLGEKLGIKVKPKQEEPPTETTTETSNAKGVEKAAKAAAKAREAANNAANKKIEQQAREHAKYMEKIYSSLSQTIIQLETDDTTKAILEINAKYDKMVAEVKGKGKTAEEKSAEAQLLANYQTMRNRELEQKVGTAAVSKMIQARYEAMRAEMEKQHKDTSKLAEQMAAELNGLIGLYAEGAVGATKDGGKSYAIVGSVQREYDAMYAQLLTAFEKGTAENDSGTRMAVENQITDFLDKYATEIGKDANLRKLVDAWAANLRKAAEEGIAEAKVGEITKDMDLGYAYGEGMTHVIRTNDLNAEMQMLADAYDKGIITFDRYKEQRAKLIEEYGDEELQIQLKILKKQLEVEGLSDDKRIELLQKVADIEKQINEKKNEEIEKQDAEAEAKRAARIQRTQELIEQFAQVAQGVGSLANALLQSEIDTLDERSKALQETYEKNATKWDELAERGAITTEEAEARKRYAQKETERQQEELEKKKRELQKRQAKWDKAMSIMETIIATSLGIMKVWQGEGTNTFKIALTAAVAAQGALQLATIMAQKIPEYAHGTDDHKGGFAIVGDAYKSEVVLTDKGAYLTPAVPTLVDLPKHAKVLPDADKLLSLQGLTAVMGGSRNSNGVVVNVDNDYTRLEKQMAMNAREIRRLNKALKHGRTEREFILNYGRV